jgi:ribonuclease-3
VRRFITRLKNLFSPDNQLSAQLEHLLGFTPKHLPYFQLALMHRSRVDELSRNNERLEFLGDAMLGAIVGEYLFKKYPTQPEGYLTELRSRIVRRETLNNVAMRMGLNKLVQYNQQDKGLDRSHIFGNAFEALIGAIYLDQGYARTRTFIVRQFLHAYIDIDMMASTDTNYKNQLLNWAQRNHRAIAFENVEEKREGSRKAFTIGIVLDGELVCTGTGFNKKLAGQVAAKKAMELLVKDKES